MSDVNDALRRATFRIPTMVPEGVRVPAVDRQVLAAEVLSLRRGTALLVQEHNREIQALRDEIALLKSYGKTSDELAAEAEAGYDLTRARPRERPGRIDLGDDPDGDNS